MRNCWCIYLIASIGMFSGGAFATATGPHVHGVANLQIVQDGSTISIDLDTPLDNLVGFEHAPRTDKQKRAVQTMLGKLNKPDALFVPTSAAQCAVAPVSIIAPALGIDAANRNSRTGTQENSQHASLTAQVNFTCSNPSALKDLDVRLFDVFPGVQRLDVQVVGPKGQSAKKLTAKQRRLAW